MSYLDAYLGPWTEKEAHHLLRRTTYSPSQAMVEIAVIDGLSQTLNSLFAIHPLPEPPVKYVPDGTTGQALNDPGATQGNTWVNAPAKLTSPDPEIVNRSIVTKRYRYGPTS